MEQEISQQRFNQSEHNSGDKVRKLIFAGIVGSIAGAAIMGVVIYFVLNNSFYEDKLNSDKRELFRKIISTLRFE